MSKVLITELNPRLVSWSSIKARFNLAKQEGVVFGWHEPKDARSGKPTFLAIPGVGHTSPTFERLGDALACRGFEFRVLNLPDHFEQLDAPKEYGLESELEREHREEGFGKLNMDQYSDYIVSYASQFKGLVYILGHSMGGILGQMVAAKMERAKLGGVVLLCSAVTSEARLGIGWGFFTQAVKNIFSIVFSLAGSFSRRAVYRLFLGRYVPRAEADRFSEYVVKESGTVMRQIVRSTLPTRVPFSLKLEGAQPAFAGLPVLNIRAVRDRLISTGTSFRLTGFLRSLGAKVEDQSIDGPHNLMWTHPEEVAEMVAGWYGRNFTS